MSQKTLPQKIGSVAGFAISQLEQNNEEFAQECALEIEKGISDPVEYPEAVEDAADIMKSMTKNENLKEMIDQVADLAVHEEDESWLDEFGDAWKALTAGLKSRKERREAKKLGSDQETD